MNRILVALDTSEAAAVVLEKAVELARASGAKLRLLRIVADKVAPPAPSIFEPAGDTRALTALAEKDLLFLEETVPEELRDGVAVELGQPWEGICRVARSYGADVVVIGAHRYGIIDRVLGTTAAKVVNHLDRPVMVVRPKPSTTAGRGGEKDQAREESGLGEERDGLPAKGRFATLEAVTLAGAASGAAVGAVGGPPGMIIGGTIGTAVGLLAGSTLDEANQRSEAHDHELDDAIGVTKGDLGARERAAAGLTAMQRAQRTGAELDDELTSVAEMLRAEHTRLEGVYDALLAAYHEGDWSDVRAQFALFEPALRAHIALEEERIFPAFREVNPAEAAALQLEHDELRKDLDAIAVGIEIHVIGAPQIEDLVRRLRAHGDREERILYPWIDASLGPEAAAKLFAA